MTSCFLGVFPPVDFSAVCLIRIIETENVEIKKRCLQCFIISRRLILVNFMFVFS